MSINFNNETLWNVDDYLLENYGAKQIPMVVLAPITCIYVLLFVSGVVSNVAICGVIVCNRTLRTSGTKVYYLFSLAMANLIFLLIGLPRDLSTYWEQYPFNWSLQICKLCALVTEMTNYASVLTIVAFSLERYLAICHPLHAYRMAGVGRAAKILAVIWFVALVSAVPFAVFTWISYVPYPQEAGPELVGHPILESAFCAMLDDNRPLLELATFIFFVVPMILLCFVYICIRRNKLIDDDRRISTIQHRPTLTTRTPAAIFSTVIIVFIVCWAPFHIQRLFYVYAKHLTNYRQVNEILFYITGCLSYLASTVNPILFCSISALGDGNDDDPVECYRRSCFKLLTGYCCCFCKPAASRSQLRNRRSLSSSSSSSSTAAARRRLDKERCSLTDAATLIGDNLLCLEDDNNIRVEAEVKLNCTHHKSTLTAEEIGEKDEANKKHQMLTILQDVLSPSGNDDDDGNRPSLPPVSFVPAAAAVDDSV